MKILFDYCTFSAQRYGGISRYFTELARHLGMRQDITTKVFAPLHINEYLPTLPNALRSGLKVPEIRYSGIIRDTVNRSVLPVHEWLYRPDIIHETFYRIPWRRLTKAKTCVTVYDMIHDKFEYLISQSELKLFHANQKIKKQTIERAELVFCISEQTRTDLVELYGIPKEKTRVTHLSASLPAIPASIPGSMPIGSVNAKPYVLFVGSRGWYKNYSTVLQAFAADRTLSRDFDLVCFGGGSFSVAEREEIQRLGLTGSVNYRGGSDVDLAQSYRAACAFIFPSRYEGFGLPLLESMWADCPLIASQASCFPEIAGTAAEYFEPLSVDDCVRALKTVLYSETRRDELIALGRDRRKMFSWQKTAEDTYLGYRALLGQ